MSRKILREWSSRVSANGTLKAIKAIRAFFELKNYAAWVGLLRGVGGVTTWRGWGFFVLCCLFLVKSPLLCVSAIGAYRLQSRT
jgi:hypothetical protein